MEKNYNYNFENRSSFRSKSVRTNNLNIVSCKSTDLKGLSVIDGSIYHTTDKNEFFYADGGKLTKLSWTGDNASTTAAVAKLDAEINKIKGEVANLNPKKMDALASKVDGAVSTATKASDAATKASDAATKAANDAKAANNAVQNMDSKISNAVDDAQEAKRLADEANGAVASKADATDVEKLSGDVETLSTTVAGKADAADVSTLSGKVDGKADATDVEKLSGDVETLSNAINDKADATDVEKLSGDVATLSTTVAGKADATTVETLSNTVDGKVDAADIDGIVEGIVENKKSELKGDTGESAYDLWKSQEGNADKSEEDFLASLKGENGTDGKSVYDLAVSKGYEGNEEDFLASLKGENGTDGKSAYELWAANSENEGKTEEDFLASLKGEGVSDDDKAAINEAKALIGDGAGSVKDIVSKEVENAMKDIPSITDGTLPEVSDEWDDSLGTIEEGKDGYVKASDVLAFVEAAISKKKVDESGEISNIEDYIYVNGYIDTPTPIITTNKFAINDFESEGSYEIILTHPNEAFWEDTEAESSGTIVFNFSIPSNYNVQSISVNINNTWMPVNGGFPIKGNVTYDGKEYTNYVRTMDDSVEGSMKYKIILSK